MANVDPSLSSSPKRQRTDPGHKRVMGFAVLAGDADEFREYAEKTVCDLPIPNLTIQLAPEGHPTMIAAEEFASEYMNHRGIFAGDPDRNVTGYQRGNFKQRTHWVTSSIFELTSGDVEAGRLVRIETEPPFTPDEHKRGKIATINLPRTVFQVVICVLPE